jgi:hypothetical protein
MKGCAGAVAEQGLRNSVSIEHRNWDRALESARNRQPGKAALLDYWSFFLEGPPWPLLPESGGGNGRELVEG